MYKIFCDYHHSGLAYSLKKLFEDRLGGSIYFPIGLDWRDKGFWKVFDHPDTAQQYLRLDQVVVPKDNTPVLNRVVQKNEDCYLVDEKAHHYLQKMVTFDQFLKLDLDFIIASIPEHIEPFNKLCKLHPKKPKLIFQAGNNFNLRHFADRGLIKYVMYSARPKYYHEKIDHIIYHQEFDEIYFDRRQHLEISGWSLKHNTKKTIYCFINCYGTQANYKSDWVRFQSLEKRLADFEFKSYGGGSRDGAISGIENVSDKIKEARFIWHCKQGGDGFGHIIHYAACMGKVILTNLRDYRGQLAGEFLEDGYTCIDIDNCEIDEIVEKICYYDRPTTYEKMSKNLIKEYKEYVNFDREENMIARFIERVKKGS